MKINKGNQLLFCYKHKNQSIFIDFLHVINLSDFIIGWLKVLSVYIYFISHNAQGTNEIYT